MKRKGTTGDWLPLAKPGRVAPGEPTGETFDAACIDFENGIRVGNLEPHERITRILKYHLETVYSVPIVTDRWGRGVFWQWICWVPRPNREAKPVSHDANWGSAKFYITVNREERVFEPGMTVERGYISGPESRKSWGLKDDWDWHRLMRQCAKGSALDEELRRLLQIEGFAVSVRSGAGTVQLDARNFTSALQVRNAAKKCPPRDWAGVNVYYPMPEAEVRSCSGFELVKAVEGVFAQVVPAMNLCMQVPLGPGLIGR
ncbi:MAG: hypothetical protein NTU62_17640 [Spirochaetes bacterium]|nr:hypothetical protein [Spirochaetota bacterium]